MPLTKVKNSVTEYLTSATGAVARGFEDKLSDFVSVKDFGAVGDGVTDDTTAIQAALDYAATVYACVRLPRGTYKTTLGLIVPSAVAMVGDGQASSVILYYGVGGSAIRLEGTMGSQVTTVDLRNFSVFNNGSGINGINMVFCVYSTFSNLRIYGFTNGISVQHCWNDIFYFLTSDANSQDGFNFTTTDANAIQLIGCQALSNGRAGLYTEGGRSVIAVGSTFEANTTYGVYISGGAANRALNYTFTGCYIEGNGTYEVYCDSATAYEPKGINFRDCYFEAITGKATTAIRVVDGTGFIVDGCTFDNQDVAYLYSAVVDGGSSTGFVWGRNADTSTNRVYTTVAYSSTAKNEAFASGRFTVSGGAIGSTNLYNVSSVTVVGTGVYEVTMQAATSGTNYVINASCENGASYNCMICSPGQPLSTTVFRIYTGSDAATPAHARTVNFAVFEI